MFAGNKSMKYVIYIVYQNLLFILKLNVSMRRMTLCYTDLKLSYLRRWPLEFFTNYTLYLMSNEGLKIVIFPG